MTRRTKGRILPRSFYRRPAEEVAPELLNKVLVAGDTAGRIVEVEAYAPVDDEASHSIRGPTARNSSMFGRPGLLYVYFTYGMHWCANAVCEREGVGAAVLIRALEPTEGLERMRARRSSGQSRARMLADRDLCSGPAKLCQALALEGASDSLDLAGRDASVTIRDDGVPPPEHADRTTRVGIRRSVELEWRWLVPGNAFVSRGRPPTTQET